MARVNPPVTKARGGKRTVTYVDSRGFTHDAIVTGGTPAAPNLRVPHLPVASRLKTAVAKRTALNSTNVWY